MVRDEAYQQRPQKSETEMPICYFHADGSKSIIKSIRSFSQHSTTYSVKQPFMMAPLA